MSDSQRRDQPRLESSAGSGPSTDELPQDLTLFVQNLMEQMQSRFNTMSDQIIGRIDEMGTRIDELESSIGELMAQAGINDDEAEEAAEARPADGRGRPGATPGLPAPPKAGDPSPS
mmetsp:Transcript_37782/g.121186  ORF Transcript_37782/g.121186 Transcript_37782/m.121186 type:complete len:117 (-) Transcript_37782:83-433(-)